MRANQAKKNLNDVYVVAHQDDDLIFMNPDIRDSIAAGNNVSIIYLTSGLNSAPDYTRYWLSRLNGVKASYAQQSALANNWATKDCSPGSVIYSTSKLVGGRVTIYAYSLPNSFYNKSFGENPRGMLWTHFATNTQLWYDGAKTFTLNASPQLGSDVDYKDVRGQFDLTHSCATGVTKATLINSLSDLYTALQLDRLNTLDHSRIRFGDHDPANFDHDDHVVSAMLALAALESYRAKGNAMPKYRTFRTYNADIDPATFDEGDPAVIQKCADLTTYSAFDSHFPKGSACRDHYRVMAFRNLQSGMRSGFSALGLRNEALAKCLNNSLTYSSCGDSNLSSHLQWELSGAGQLKSGSLCLTSSNGTTEVGMASCKEVPDITQIWHLTDYGQIKGNGAKCLGVVGDRLVLSECPLASTQSASKKSPTSWAVLPGNFSMVASALSDRVVGMIDRTKYQSTMFGVLRPGKQLDICYRLASGLHCLAQNVNQTYPAAGSLVSTQFSDANGWGNFNHQVTIQFADVNADGLDDVCAAKGNKVFCYPNTSNYSSISFSSNAVQIYAAATLDTTLARNESARTLRFADVNGDGRPDLCFRSASGLNCALNTTSLGVVSFGWLQTVLASSIGDSAGWGAPYYGGTLMMGDVNADGRADACLRGKHGVSCFLSTSIDDVVSFQAKTLWTQGNQLSDAAGWKLNVDRYRNIRLVDIDGDGLADLCSRDASGISCGRSTGKGFGPLSLLTVKEFSDGNGWGAAAYAQTLVVTPTKAGLARKICMRGKYGLSCITPN